MFDEERVVIVEISKGEPHPLFNQLNEKYHGAVKFA